MKKQIYLLAIIVIIISCKTQPDSSKGTKPNVVIVQMDDLGWDDLASHGNKYVETPTLDALAERSVKFNHFYVNPVCAPTRASLLTGRHFLKTGVSHVHGGKDFLHLDEKTIANLFKEAGYKTGMWGKWHSGHTPGYYPWQRGFDEAYMAQLYKHRNTSGVYNGHEAHFKQWADERLVDFAIDFISRNKEEPFLAYLASMTCHSPLDAPKELVEKYYNKGLSTNLSILYAMIDNFDSQVNRLFDHIDELGLSDNTIIMFLSDNGPAVINNLLTDEDRKIRYVNQYKGHKGNIWENGVKSPLFVYFGSNFMPKTLDEVCDVTDIVPTLLDLCGIENHQEIDFDGISFLPLLESKRAKRDEEKVSFNYAHKGWQPTKIPWSPAGTHDEYRPISPKKKDALSYLDQPISVYKKGYKMILNAAVYDYTPKAEENFVLFNIKEDPKEEINLYNSEKKVANDLKQELENWWNAVVQSPHSFSMPMFKVGHDSTSSAFIYAKGAQDLSEGITPTSHQLTNFEKGDSAIYLIDVITPGEYQVSPIYSKDSDFEGKWVIITKNSSVQFTQVEPGIISLEKGVQMVKIALNSSPNGNEFKLQGIYLDRLK